MKRFKALNMVVRRSSSGCDVFWEFGIRDGRLPLLNLGGIGGFVTLSYRIISLALALAYELVDRRHLRALGTYM